MDLVSGICCDIINTRVRTRVEEGFPFV